jgi:hypothetical protein
MIPSGYKEDTVFSQIPTDGSGDMAFTRASNGTRINSAGLVEVTPWNLVENSENFSVWSAQGSSVSTDSTTAPNGTTTADTIIESNTTDEHNRFVEPNIGSGQFTYSVYLKKYNADWCALYVFNTAVGGVRHWVNLSTLTAGTSANIGSGIGTTSVSISDVGNGWCRASITFTNPSGNCRFYVANAQSNGGSSNYAGNGTSGVYAWGGQVNIGSTAKPYFPTTDRLNVPRLTYQNGGGGCPSLLLEKQSTNLFTYSEQIDNAAWFYNNLTIMANQAISPDGTQNADLLDDGTASSTQHWIYQGTSFSNSTAYTISFYAKYVSRKYMAVNIYNGATSQYVVYDIQNGSVYGSTGDVTASITSVGNGWYRVVYTRTMSASGSPNFRIAMADDTGNETYTGSNKQVYVWGFQCEASSYATSYIPTTSSSATRVADECSKTGITSLIGQTEGVLFVDFVFTAYDNSAKWIAFLGGGTAYVGIYAGAGNEIFGEVYNSSTQAIITFNSFVVGTRYKMALAYKANDFAFYVNGVQIGTDSSGTVPTTADFNFLYSTTNDRIGGKVYNQLALFKTRLTNAELASLTTI